MKTDIVLIDTGVEWGHQEIKNSNISGLSINRSEEGQYSLSPDISDNSGHGTAIYYILNKNAVNADIFVLKLFGSNIDDEIDLEDMIFALEYILDNIDCKIVHMSFGISYCDDIPRFYQVCRKLCDKGIILISAFDNQGTVSYPAAFDNVIGVDICDRKLKNFDYIYVKNSPVNVRFTAKEQRLPFINNEYSNVVGSSFMTPYITKLVIDNYESISSKKMTLGALLERNSCEIVELEMQPVPKKLFSLNNAIVFPFNKEVHSIIANHSLCHFTIQDIYDIKYLGNVGKRVSDVLGYGDELLNSIKDFSRIDWNENFDTVILGHVKELEELIGTDYIDYFVKNCIRYNKKLYCFDDISDYLLKNNISGYLENIFYPGIQEEKITDNTFGKLYCIGRPVLAVMGTSPKQGKYSLQLILRKELDRAGFSIGQLGTEPSAALFGFNEMYSYGYGAATELSGSRAVYYLNYLMNKIEKENTDIIITGSQSQTVHYNTGNLRCYSIQNVEFLLGIDPDLIILCVNYFDSIQYIRRTINFIENFQEGKVIAVVLYPFMRDIRWSTLGNRKTRLSQRECNDFKEIIMGQLKLPCFILADNEDMKLLVQAIIDHLT